MNDKEKTKMNTNMNELNLDEMEQVNGGVDPAKLVGPAAAGGIFGGAVGGAAAIGLGLAAGPAGWLVLGSVAAGGALFATIKTLTSN